MIALNEKKTKLLETLGPILKKTIYLLQGIRKVSLLLFGGGFLLSRFQLRIQRKRMVDLERKIQQVEKPKAAETSGPKTPAAGEFFDLYSLLSRKNDTSSVFKDPKSTHKGVKHHVFNRSKGCARDRRP